MAKEFKNYDKAFTKAQILKKRSQYMIGIYESITRWIYADKIEVHSNERIRECVYFIYDAEEWQLFRVSLKGLTTQQKLLMLQNRYDTWVNQTSVATECVAKVEKVRIDNYIGALVRGGQLAAGTYEVLK